MDKITPISDVVWFQEGPGVRNTQYTTEGVKLLNVANLVDGEVDLSNTNRYISEEEAYGKYKHFLVDEGDLIIASSGIKVDYFDKKMGFIKKEHLPLCMNTSTIRFKTLNADVLDIRYFMYFLKSESFKQQLAVQITGSAQLNFGPSHLKKMSVKMVPMAQQKEIVHNLSEIDRLISYRQQQLIKLDELVKARFVELFGDPVENPYGWEQTTLKNIAIGKLSYGSGASACEYDEKIRYVRITDIDSIGRLNNDVVSPSVIDEKYILNDGDILFARSGATVGKSYRYRECDGKCLYAGYLIRLVPNTALVLPDYVFYYTKTSYYERFIASNMKVVAQPNINAQQYGDLTICIPPMELQKDFLSFVEQTDKSKLAIQQSLDKLETLKKALMQKYFG